MNIVTIASREPTEPYYAYKEFVASCRRFGIDPIVLRDGYGGLGTKPVILRDAIRSGQVPPGKIIFCDAFDVIFQRDPRDSGLENPELNLLIGAEINCFPNGPLCEKFPETKTPFRYLNSGFMCGVTSIFLECIEQIPMEDLKPDRRREDGSWITPNDQQSWQELFIQNLGGYISLDCRAEFVLNTFNVPQSDVEVRDGLIHYLPTDTCPVAFHMNGSKEQWKEFLKKNLAL